MPFLTQKSTFSSIFTKKRVFWVFGPVTEGETAEKHEKTRFLAVFWVNFRVFGPLSQDQKLAKFWY
jgi:hypothetical protein